MLVKVEGDDPALPPMSPFDGFDDYFRYDEEEEEGEEHGDEETDSDSSGDGVRGAGEPPLKKGPWTPDEDKRLRDYVQANGEGNWNQVRINAGLNRCGKSCRLRWSNHLRPGLKKGPLDDEEVEKIIKMHMAWGNKWARMAALLPGRTDNEIKNYWNTRQKRHQRAGLPIYPEYLASQASNQDMNFGTPEESRGTKRSNEFSQDPLEINDLMGKGYFNTESFARRFPMLDMGDLPCPSLVGPNSLPMDAMNPLQLVRSSDSVASDYDGSFSFVQIPDEFEKARCSTSFNYGMIDNQSVALDNAIISGHSISNINPSASWITQRSMKIELPSVQYSNYAISNNAWVPDCPSGSIEQPDNLIESPGSLKSESISPQNTGLDAMVHKGDGIIDPIESQGVLELLLPPFSCNQVSQSTAYTRWHSFSSIPVDDEIEGCPRGGTQASDSPFSSDAILAEAKCHPDTSFTGKHLSYWADSGTLDASLEAANLLNDESLFSKDQNQSISIYNSLIDEDSIQVAELSTAGHGRDSLPRNNMSDFSNL